MKGTKILVIEDSPLYRQQLSEMLRSRGIEVKEAGSLRTGILALTGDLYDVVLLDLHLPDAAGLHALHELAPMCQMSPQIVVVSGNAEVTAEQVVEAGALAFIQKPTSAQPLLDAIGAAAAHARRLRRRSMKMRQTQATVSTRNLRVTEYLRRRSEGKVGFEPELALGA